MLPMTPQLGSRRLHAWYAAAVAAMLCLGVTHAADTVTGHFELVDHHGQTVTEASYEGRLRLVFFGFTRCPVICPTTMVEVTRVMGQLGERSGQVQPIFISIDPDNDTTDVVASYVGHFHPAVVGLTGTREQIANAARSFNVTYGGTNVGAQDVEIYHSSYLYLMDRDGGLIDIFGYGAKAATIIDKLEKYL